MCAWKLCSWDAVLHAQPDPAQTTALVKGECMRSAARRSMSQGIVTPPETVRALIRTLAQAIPETLQLREVQGGRVEGAVQGFLIVLVAARIAVILRLAPARFLPARLSRR